MTSSLYTELLDRLTTGLNFLPDKPEETPETTLMALWSYASGHPLAPSELDGYEPAPLDEPAAAELTDFVEKRLRGTPLAHLTGRQSFMGVGLLASPDAMIPRAETELLGYCAVEKIRECTTPNPLVVDICTGGGTVALGIAVHAPHAHVFGADLSPEAIELARSNAEFVGRPDVTFRCGDLLEPFEEPDFYGSVDILTCNPPYISSGRVARMPEEISRFEPSMAFDGGPFGIGIIRRCIADGPRFLKPGGWLLMEVGAGQAEGMARTLRRTARFDAVQTPEDAQGTPRVVAARLAADAPSGKQSIASSKA